MSGSKDDAHTDLSALRASAEPVRRERRIAEILAQAETELARRAEEPPVEAWTATRFLSDWFRPAASVAGLLAAAALAALLLLDPPRGAGTSGIAGHLLPGPAAQLLESEDPLTWMDVLSRREAVGR